MQLIVLLQDGEKPKNYSWRKDMEAYEDNLEKMTEHKKTVRESTKATRDVVSYKSTDDKIRDYERESRRNVDTDAPIIRRNKSWKRTFAKLEVSQSWRRPLLGPSPG